MVTYHISYIIIQILDIDILYVWVVMKPNGTRTPRCKPRSINGASRNCQRKDHEKKNG